jgi:hypothetical protein
MNVRLENLHADTASNYVSFLGQSRGPKGKGSDHGSIHSVSSMRSVMSGMSSLWSSFGIGGGSSTAKAEKQAAAIQADLKYLYSAFTKIPCLRLAPDRRARLIQGYEEFPFDSAVPLYAFKNISALEVVDIDIRQFFGWDRLAEQLRSLTVKRASVEEPADLLINIVLDDMDRRRRRSSKAQMSPVASWALATSPRKSPTMPQAELAKSNSAPGSPDFSTNPDELDARASAIVRSGSADLGALSKGRPRSNSPVRPTSSRTGSAHGHVRGSHKIKRSGSASSQSSTSDNWYNPRGSSSNLLAPTVLPPSKWRFLKHLCLADNSLTSISADGFAPLANTLHSLDLSTNLFTQIPDCLASLTALRALNLSNCMIESLHSLTRNPLPAISALNLRANRLASLAGIERLYPLERLDLRENKLSDPTELARLTGVPELREIWVAGNPFTRTHPNYRVTIFNLFRKTPGYTEDIIIDASGPGYNERRQLVERAAERSNVPVVMPAPPDNGPPIVDVNKPLIVHDEPKEPSVLRKERPAALPTTSEIYSSGSRRRKTPRRRIVDLSTPDTSPAKLKNGTVVLSKSPVAGPSGDPSAPLAGTDIASAETLDSSLNSAAQVDTRPDMHRSSSSPEARVVRPELGHAATVRLVPGEPFSDQTSPVKFAATDTQEWRMSGETYRKKIEALRSEVGNGWLSVLSEESWEPQKPPPSAVRPSTTSIRANNQQAIHSGRTLG